VTGRCSSGGGVYTAPGDDRGRGTRVPFNWVPPREQCAGTPGLFTASDFWETSFPILTKVLYADSAKDPSP
jgi:hypothetical protein